jgi:hypothetical protein
LEIVPTKTISTFLFHCEEEMPGQWTTPYRYEATTIEGFVQQLAVQYVARGYWFYVSGIVPEGKDSRAVAEKLIAKYNIGVSKFVRARRKLNGSANLQLILYGRIFLLLATHGEHPFFEAERTRIRDCREAPIKFASYSIGFRGGHAQVRIERETEKELKAFFKTRALWSEETLARLFSQLPFEPYAPVRRQFLVMLNQVNRIRKTAGLDRIETSCLRLSRKPCRPFELESSTFHLSTVVGEATIGRSIGTYRKV